MGCKVGSTTSLETEPFLMINYILVKACFIFIYLPPDYCIIVTTFQKKNP